MRYSAFALIAKAIDGHASWPRAWRDADPRPTYDVVIVGAGGHGLATAYYLAKEHGVKSVAVLEKGWLGGGNTGRNTTIVRSNYMMPGNTKFYERSLRLWENLSRDLNFNVMFSQRGQYNLCHSPAQMDAARRRGNIMRANGIDAELFSRAEVRLRLPYLDYSDAARFPITGALYQGRAGTARHDAVAWGYARLPIETHVLQAFVSEPLKPLVDTVISYGAAHFYISQSDKGGLVFGGDLDGYNSYAQRGGLPLMEHTLASAKALMPCISRLRVLRNWGGVMDMTMDGSPIISASPIAGLYLNGGWCYGGFKATPASGWCYAWTIAKDEPHPDNAEFTLSRFRDGYQIDEKGAGPTPNAQ
jgi:methylglutamate dehydrogenase subunit A